MSDDGALAVWEALRSHAAAPVAAHDAPLDDWPGVADPDALRGQLLDWLGQYANAGTRRTYAYALGLPVAWVDAFGGVLTPGAGPRTPPPAPRGPLHHLAWFRWCASRSLDPRAATGREVKAWLHALDAAGASRRTRQRMLSTLSALYGHLTETGAVAANPAALNRGRLGLSSTARDASPTVRLTAAQLRTLLLAAGDLPHGNAARLHRLYATRAVAFVALLTLGLRISELVGLDRADLRTSGGEEVLRVLGKGGHHREVYVTDLVAVALDAYLAERDRVAGAAAPARRGRTAATASPLIATRDGGRCSRVDLYTLLRRIAEHAGPALGGVADRVHPHALRHAYVTIALEQDARIHHVQADVGHASIATTQHYDRGLRTRSTTAADLVAAAIAAVPAGDSEPSP
jgi:site-specific recombinase XerD